MFLEKYLSTLYLDMIYDSYDEKYIELLDEENFVKIYMLLKCNGFYFIDDIILKYLELFEIEERYVKQALLEIKKIFGDDYVKEIGKNMVIIDKITYLAISYSEEDILGIDS